LKKLPDKQWFRPDEVADALEEPIANVYYWLRQDLIKHIHVGGRTKIPRTELARILSRGTIPIRAIKPHHSH
jgi:hypothetical protein